MKVLFLHLENGPISWYRMIQYANEMCNIEDMDPIYPKFDPELHDKETRDYEQDIEKFMPEINKLFEIADICVVHPAHDLKFLAALRAFAEVYKVPLVMELDDNPFEIDENHYGFKQIGVGSNIERNVYDQLKFSKAAITSTSYLKSCIEPYIQNVYVVPNCIDFNIWDKLTVNNRNLNTVIGWAGANGHQKDLGLIKDVFTELLNRNPNIIIKCLHGAKDLITHERFFNDDTWTDINNYPKKLASLNLDIGVAPLWDSEFNRCKSNLRYLEYSALSVPTVASRVQPYRESITNGKNGYLASSAKEFIDKIQYLIDNPLIRKNIGYTAYQNVKENYNIKSVTQNYADILRQILMENTDVNISANQEQNNNEIRSE